jgi:hypothetical protein
MVWLNRPSGEEGGNSPRLSDFYLSSLHVEEGGRGSAPCGWATDSTVKNLRFFPSGYKKQEAIKLGVA